MFLMLFILLKIILLNQINNFRSTLDPCDLDDFVEAMAQDFFLLMLLKVYFVPFVSYFV